VVIEPQQPENAMTKAQLKRFVSRRNKSEFQTNLQFKIDAEACGFRISELGEARKIGDHMYIWDTPHGFLREHHGVMSLERKAENGLAA
jgi:hypothetical protein